MRATIGFEGKPATAGFELRSRDFSHPACLKTLFPLMTSAQESKVQIQIHLQISSSSSADQTAKFEANRSRLLVPEIETPKLDSETPSHRPFCARASQGCFDHVETPGSIRKPESPFGAATFPFKITQVRLKLNPLPPHLTGKKEPKRQSQTPPGSRR